MPTLPTFTITDDQANRILAAFGDVATYKQWLKRQIIQEVLRHEAKGMRDQVEGQIASMQDQVSAQLANIE